MADNLSRARVQLDGHRKQIRESIKKSKTYPMPYQQENQLKTIQNVQNQIAKLIDRYPTLKNERSWEDSWRKGSPTPGM